MKNFLVLLYFAISVLPVRSFGAVGDIQFFLPLEDANGKHESQLSHNKEYFSIRLRTVFTYYKSGFFENIKTVLVASDLTLTPKNGKALQAAAINKTWQKHESLGGEFIGVNDHLVSLAPTTPINVKLTIQFRGIGEDRFKYIFDTLGDPAVKTAMNLSPASSAIAGIVTPIVQKFVSSPYTESNKRQILDLETSYNIYEQNTPTKGDGLREGYLVVVSGREAKSAAFASFNNLNLKDLRVSPRATLEYRDGEAWKAVDQNSYAIIEITSAKIRGPDEDSAWFSKYREAVNNTEEKVIDGKTPLDEIKSTGLDLWKQGTLLLTADPSYIESERRQIRAFWYKELTNALQGKPLLATNSIALKELGVDQNFTDVATDYKKQVITSFITPIADSEDKEKARELASLLQALPFGSPDVLTSFSKLTSEWAKISSLDPNTKLALYLDAANTFAKLSPKAVSKQPMMDVGTEAIYAEFLIGGYEPQRIVPIEAEQKIKMRPGASDVLRKLGQSGYVLDR